VKNKKRTKIYYKPPLLAYRDAAENLHSAKVYCRWSISSEKSRVGRTSAERKRTPIRTTKQTIFMIRHILVLAAATGFIAQSSVFAADPTPAPSPAKAAVTETASPSPSAKKTRRRTRVEARRTGRTERREARRGPSASPSPAAKASPSPKQ
jgi:hypothetical protein